MLSRSDIEAAAGALVEAERSGAQTGLLSVRHPQITLDDAYAIQAAFIKRKLATGRRVVGCKIGLTSRVMQEALGIDTPDSGVLLDDMAFADGATVPAGRFIQPRIEAEIAFIMKSVLEGEVTREEVIAATESVVPSLEILDTRILRKDPQTGAARKIFDTVADNAANAGFVLGSQRHSPETLDLRWAGVILKRDGEVVATGLGAGVLDDPVTALIWLSRRLASVGQRIETGQVVLSGSFISPVECPPGTRIDADFGTFGSIAIGFE
ncbi:MAG: 2-oxo-hepta-3-ene-1,7-dioic acid hydratase [Nitratireductor sp.]|nr:2-oxo-hepta-3-ene-1,7-dioic acid hydratase [Nitratireductor sp.]